VEWCTRRVDSLSHMSMIFLYQNTIKFVKNSKTRIAI
jgi:hypothetical protein